MTSKLAIASLCCGILYPIFVFAFLALNSLDCPPNWVGSVADIVILISIFLPFMAVLLGHLGRRKISRAQESIDGWGLAGVGFKLGYLWLACWIISAIIMPNVDGSRAAFHEATAVGSLRTLSNAIQAYANAHPEQGFPRTLAELSQNTPLSTGKTWAIHPDLANGEMHCYRFIYTPHVKTGKGKLDSFEILAEPVPSRMSGLRYFSINETGTISFGYTRDTTQYNTL